MQVNQVSVEAQTKATLDQPHVHLPRAPRRQATRHPTTWRPHALTTLTSAILSLIFPQPLLANPHHIAHQLHLELHHTMYVEE